MSASLVGSEMCIRDRLLQAQKRALGDFRADITWEANAYKVEGKWSGGVKYSKEVGEEKLMTFLVSPQNLQSIAAEIQKMWPEWGGYDRAKDSAANASSSAKLYHLQKYYEFRVSPLEQEDEDHFDEILEEKEQKLSLIHI
eukprot:13920149-Alexandrium_andersonii.AAC.1